MSQRMNPPTVNSRVKQTLSKLPNFGSRALKIKNYKLLLTNVEVGHPLIHFTNS